MESVFNSVAIDWTDDSMIAPGEWFDSRPIPEIVGGNTSDPKLLGEEQHLEKLRTSLHLGAGLNCLRCYFAINSRGDVRRVGRFPCNYDAPASPGARKTAFHGTIVSHLLVARSAAAPDANRECLSGVLNRETPNLAVIEPGRFELGETARIAWCMSGTCRRRLSHRVPAGVVRNQHAISRPRSFHVADQLNVPIDCFRARRRRTPPNRRAKRPARERGGRASF